MNSPRTLIRRICLPAVALVLLASACGDGDTTGSDSGGDTTTTSSTSTSTQRNEEVNEEPGEVDVALLTVDRNGCIEGFAKASVDQSLALFIFAHGAEADSSAPIVFPSEKWTGEIRFGTDLFAGLCEPVSGPGVPKPEIKESWTLVRGSLTVDANVSGREWCSGNVVNGLLSDAVVESPSGERAALSDLTLTDRKSVV